MDLEKTLQQAQVLSHQAVEYLAERSNLEKIGKITAISVATYVVANKLYDAFFGPLGKVPGPFLGKFMEVPSWWYDRPSGTMFQKFRDFHDTYGEVVRLGPKIVAISNKDWIKQVLLTDDLQKGPHYESFQGNGRLSMFSATDKIWHKQRRRIVSPAFSIKYLNSLEPFMHKVTESLVAKIDKEIAKDHDQNNYGKVDIWNLMQCLALDVIGETAFGSTFNMIEDNSHFVPKAISEEMIEGAISSMYPILSKFMLKNGGKVNPELQQFLGEIIENRLKEGGNKRHDILQFLIDSQKSREQDDRLTTEGIMNETILFLIAGSETTSNTIGFAIIQLLRNPDELAKLQAEIDQLEFKEGEIVFDHEQLKHLSYLNAVINETLRTDTVAGGALGRITTAPAYKLGNLTLEKGTEIHTTFYHTHTNSKYFPDPFKFNPERWIPEEQSELEYNDLEAYFPFSVGTRNCIGKNFALQEMRISLATFLKHFEIKPIEQEMKDAEDRRTFITQSVAKNQFHIKVKRRVPLNH